MSRTINSYKNIKYTMIGQAITIVATFVTRLIFVKILSIEYLGLSGLISNILSILSFAELGIGTAIMFSMYKPLASGDKMKLKAYMLLFRRSYLKIGIITLIVGIGITPLLKRFTTSLPDLPNIEIIYIMYVVSLGTSYFFSYNRLFLVADQKKYIDSFYHYTTYIIGCILQIGILLITKSFILYLGVQLGFLIIGNIFISRKVYTLYPFLKEKNSPSLEKEEVGTIIKNVKALICNKLGSVLVLGSDNIIISKFEGIVMVGIYSNYLLIINVLNDIFEMVFQSLAGSIGNLAVTESDDRKIFIFNCIDLLGFWIYAFSSICLINLLNPLIRLWIGRDYVLPLSVVILTVFNFYLNGRRKSVNTYINSLGLFWYVKYRALIEAIFKLTLSVVLGGFLGIKGVISGSIISTLIISFWFEPYVLFKYGFKCTVTAYFARYFKWTAIFIITGIISGLICNLISDYSLIGFIHKMIVCSTLPNILLLLSLGKSKELKYLIIIFKKIIMDKKDLLTN